MPWSSQSRKRRQQVLGEGYRSGKSFHRAPLRSTQRIPSKQGRLAIGLGPPNAEPLGNGNSGAINAHCASVINSTFLAIEHLHSTTSTIQIQISRNSIAARNRENSLESGSYETGSRDEVAHVRTGGGVAPPLAEVNVWGHDDWCS
jgi:hypothetical protein